jgi:hypothetical protein
MEFTAKSFNINKIKGDIDYTNFCKIAVEVLNDIKCDRYEMNLRIKILKNIEEIFIKKDFKNHPNFKQLWNQLF